MRFKPRHSQDALLAIVRDVALYANREAPTTVSQTAFNDARAQAGHADAPTARAIAKRFQVSWAALLEAVHGKGRDAPRTLTANRPGHGRRRGLSLDQVLNATRLVAARLDRDDIDRTDYATTRDAIVSHNRRAYRHGRRADVLLPSLNQVEQVLRQHGLTWTDRLERAGLRRRRRAASGLTATEAVDGFIQDTGLLPSSVQQLREWGAARGQPIVRGVKRRELDQICDAFNSDRSDRLARAPGDLDLTVLERTLTPKARRPKLDWDEDSIIDGMARALDLLEPGERLTQRTLRRIARDNPGLPIPAYPTVHAHATAAGATFVEWRDEAVARHAARRSARS